MILQKTQGTKLYICPIKSFSDVVCVLLKDILESCILLSGISEPRFYGDLVYKFRRIVGKPNFSDRFKKIIKRFKRLDITI